MLSDDDLCRQEVILFAFPYLCLRIICYPSNFTLHIEFLTESNGFLRKRVRSSSFTLHTTHLQSQGGRYRPDCWPFTVMFTPSVKLLRNLPDGKCFKSLPIR